MFGPYTQMMQGAGMDPQMQEQMKNMMLSRMIMGGGAAMLNAGSNNRNFGNALSKGIMGGMQGMDQGFNQALQYQKYSNQQKRQDKMLDRLDKRDEIADKRYTEQQIIAANDRKYRLAKDASTASRQATQDTETRDYRDWQRDFQERKLLMNPYAALMAGGGQPDTVDAIPQAPGEMLKQQEQTQLDMVKQAMTQKLIGDELSIHKVNPISNRYKGARAQEFADKIKSAWPTMSPEDRQRVMPLLKDLRQKHNVNLD